MKIIETTIPDVSKENLDKSKIILADNIVQNVYPLFDEVFNTKVSELEELQKLFTAKKLEVQTEKESLQAMMDDYNKRKKVAKLLDRIEKLVSSGLVYDGSLKNETTVLLKIAPKLSDEKLDYHLKSVMTTISKRFSRD